mgnify:CR=1 FL=1
MHNHQDEPAILYFGNDWAAENRTSSHHVARWLAAKYSVYYVECPGLRAPSGSSRDVKKLFRKLWNALRGMRSTKEGIKVGTLLQVPFHRFALVRRLNHFLALASLRWMMWREGVRRPIAWFVPPHLPFLVGRLGECLSVYYCIDDYAAMPGVNPQAIRAMDEEMTRRANLVFVASQTLLATKRQLNANTTVSPHGVDYEHFAQAQNGRLPIPADIADRSRPIVGFFGLIEKWIDLELIDYLAEQRPNWSFVLIGRTAVPEESLPRRSNIHYLGKRPYESLPAYGQCFDAAIIPYRPTQQVYHANPLKLREYLAMGKPIVSVSTPEIDQFADVVAIAHSREEFLAKLDEVLACPPSPADIQRRMDRVVSSSWDVRLRRVLEIVQQELNTSSKGEPATSSSPSASLQEPLVRNL